MADALLSEKQLAWAKDAAKAAIMSNYAGQIVIHFKQNRILQIDVDTSVMLSDTQAAKAEIDLFSRVCQSGESLTFTKRPDGRYGGRKKKTLKPIE